MTSTPDLEQDGITHINCYSKGRTELGRNLSNFAHVPFKHVQYGFFSSVEAFWYYVATGFKYEHLRRLHGAFAKSAGSKLERVMMDEGEFRKLICEAIEAKITQNPNLLQMLVENELPLEHYYVYGTGATAIVRSQTKHRWQLDHIESIARRWREASHEVPPKE